MTRRLADRTSCWSALIAVAVATAVPSTAAAQVCAAAPTFQASPVRVEGTAGLGDSVAFVGTGVAVGTESFFATAGIGSVKYAPFRGWPVTASLGFGYQLSVDSRSRLQVCPTAELSFVAGPDSLYSGYGSNVGHRATSLAMGVSAGARAGGSAMSVGVSASLAAVRTTRRHADSYGLVESERSTTGMLKIAVSLTVGDAFTVRPWVGMPFGQSRYSARIKIRDASTRAAISVGFRLGRRPSTE